MHTRAAFALALLLAACSPPQSAEAPADAAAPQADAPAANPYVAALASAPAEGEWLFRSDDGVVAACFGLPESECQVVVQCEQPTGKLTVMVEHELTPDQDTAMRLFTATRTLDLPARSFNEGLPSVTAELADTAAEKTPLIGMLGAPTDRFGVEIAGESRVFPWDDAVARTLIACR